MQTTSVDLVIFKECLYIVLLHYLGLKYLKGFNGLKRDIKEIHICRS